MTIPILCTLPSQYCYRYPVCAGANASQTATEAADLLNVTTAAGLATLRSTLRTYIWGASGFPSDLPTVDVAFAPPADFSTCDGLDSLDRYTFTTLPFGVTQYAYRLHPTATSNGRVFIWNPGHGENEFTPERNMPQQALLAGYDVVCCPLPFEGTNTDGTYLGSPLNDTDDMLGIELVRDSLGYSALRLFFEPLAQIVNQLASEGETEIALSGVSGGGWTVQWYAALDERILCSYPIAGSLPWWALMQAYSPALPGGYETYLAQLYEMANYEDIYMMAASAMRRCVQINGEDDTVNPGAYIADYFDALRGAALPLGSNWLAVSDHSTTAHMVTPAMASTVLADINGFFASRNRIEQAVST